MAGALGPQIRRAVAQMEGMGLWCPSLGCLNVGVCLSSIVNGFGALFRARLCWGGGVV